MVRLTPRMSGVAILLLAGLLNAGVALAQETTALGLSVSLVEPEGLDTAAAPAIWARLPVRKELSLHLELSGWKVSERQRVFFPSPPGSDTISHADLDYPVSDLSLLAAPLYRILRSERYDLRLGIGPSLHYVTSDIARLRIDNDSDLRLGLSVLGQVEAPLSRRVSIFASPRYDAVDRLAHFRMAVGFTLRSR